MRRAKRRDDNEPAIVDALRAIGCIVQPLDQGDGVPDLLVGRDGLTLLVEVKNPANDKGALPGGKRTKGRGQLTPDQVTWFAAWLGSPVLEVVTADEAVCAVRRELQRLQEAMAR